MQSSLTRKFARELRTADRPRLTELHGRYRGLHNEQLRRLIIERDRIDLLCSGFLGLDLQPMHLSMLRWQFLHPNNLQLVYRGAGKTSILTVAKAIHMIIKDRDIKILLGSKTLGQAEDFLKEIKGHLESNARLIEVFGEFHGPDSNEWNNSAIEVLGRTKRSKEATITTAGIGTAIVGRHYNVHLLDDLIDEENCRTPMRRERMRVWNYQTLAPTLLPVIDGVPHSGESHRHGTRYHYQDLYGHWIEGSPDGSGGELKSQTQVIPGLDEHGNSPWASRHSPAWFEKKKAEAGLIIFNCQYQCRTDMMKGKVFRYDDIIIHADGSEDVPSRSKMKVFAGVDLAIGQKEENDQFAIVVIGCIGKVRAGKRSNFSFYVLDYYLGRLRFSQQTKKIIEMIDRWHPIRTAIEKNAYQGAQLDVIQEEAPGARVVGIQTDQDKMTRAWNLSPVFEAGKANFQQTQGPLIDQIVLFPDHRFDDGFDALDLAVTVARKRSGAGVTSRSIEPGLI